MWTKDQVIKRRNLSSANHSNKERKENAMKIVYLKEEKNTSKEEEIDTLELLAREGARQILAVTPYLSTARLFRKIYNPPERKPVFTDLYYTFMHR